MLVSGCSGSNLGKACDLETLHGASAIDDRLGNMHQRERQCSESVICQCPSSLTGLCLLLQSRGKFTSSYATSLLTLANYVTQVPVLLLPPVHPMCWKKSSSPVRNSHFTARKSAGRCWCWIHNPEFRECKLEKICDSEKHMYTTQ